MKNDHLYLIQSDKSGMIKIGRSVDPEKRLKNLQTGNPNRLKLIAVFENQGYREKLLHEELDRFRKKGEWFTYECVGSIPIDIYDSIPYGMFDDWWKK